jgi:hypothetical protein
MCGVYVCVCVMCVCVSVCVVEGRGCLSIVRVMVGLGLRGRVRISIGSDRPFQSIPSAPSGFLNQSYPTHTHIRMYAHTEEVLTAFSH